MRNFWLILIRQFWLFYSSNLNGQDYNVRTWILSDNSGYFVIAVNTGSSKVNIWKYLFASPTSVSWFETSNLSGNTNNQMKLSDTQLFFISLDNSSPSNLHMCKVAFGSTSVDWAKMIMCPTSSWDSYTGETLMSSDGSVMYTFFLYGDTAAMYAHFLSMNPSSGGVIGTRYTKKTKINLYSQVSDSMLLKNHLKFFKSKTFGVNKENLEFQISGFKSFILWIRNIIEAQCCKLN